MAQSPEHYGNNWKIGDFIREQELGFHLGNVVKYVCRAGKKVNNTKRRDLEQAIAYLENELEKTQDDSIGSSQRVSGRLLDTKFPEWESDSEIFDR